MSKIAIENLKGEKVKYDMMDIKPNYAEIGRMFKIDPRTVKKYFDGYDGKPTHHMKKSNIENYDDIIREKMEYNGIKISALYNYLVEETDFKYSYNSLAWYIRKNNIPRKKSAENGKVLFETRPGEQLQFDWVESIKLTNKYGEIFEFNVFSAELAYSRFHYFCYSITKTREDVIKCLIQTFKFMNGIPEHILTDNMSSIVNNGKFIEEFVHFAKDVGIKTKKCKVRHCFTKGKVEVRNKFMKWLILYNNSFETEEDIIKIINTINRKVNERHNERIGTKPILLFNKEKEYLLPLPAKDIFEHYLDLKKAVKVSSLSMFNYKGNQYSVPRKYINKTLKIKEIDNKLHIYDNTDLVLIRDISDKKINYSQEDYIECLSASMPNKDKDFIDALAKKNLNLFNQLVQLNKEEIKMSKQEVNMYLKDIVEYANSALRYLKDDNKNLDKAEIIMYLSTVEETIRDIQKYIFDKDNEYYKINKKNLESYLHYLNDKVGAVYKDETTNSIYRFLCEF